MLSKGAGLKLAILRGLETTLGLWAAFGARPLPPDFGLLCLVLAKAAQCHAAARLPGTPAPGPYPFLSCLNEAAFPPRGRLELGEMSFMESRNNHVLALLRS